MGSSSHDPPAFVRLAGHPVRWRLLTELAGGDLRVRELVGLLGQPQSLISYHLRLLRGGGLVSATRSSFDGRDSYYHLDLDRCAEALAGAGTALHPALRPEPAGPARRRLAVLFVCTGNSVRSPIAAALLRQRTAGRMAALSAGSRPKPELHPDAVRLLRDRFGIDVADQRPRHVDTLAGRRLDYVITLCDKAREVCPDFEGPPRRAHWSIPDPAGGGRTGFTRTAADIDTRIRQLLPVLAAIDPKEGAR
jgi:protein-tyrosine-phosphatase/DNA-binding transcriptional ArsR family regulator